MHTPTKASTIVISDQVDTVCMCLLDHIYNVRLLHVTHSSIYVCITASFNKKCVITYQLLHALLQKNNNIITLFMFMLQLELKLNNYVHIHS